MLACRCLTRDNTWWPASHTSRNNSTVWSVWIMLQNHKQQIINKNNTNSYSMQQDQSSVSKVHTSTTVITVKCTTHNVIFYNQLWNNSSLVHNLPIPKFSQRSTHKFLSWLVDIRHFKNCASLLNKQANNPKNEAVMEVISHHLTLKQEQL